MSFLWNGLDRFDLKIEAAGSGQRSVLPGILAALAIFWAVAPVAAEVRLNQASPRLLEVTGGTGKDAWRIRFGLFPGMNLKSNLLVVANDRAWFSHAGWLRLLDTKKGVVIGRWHFPGEISRLKPAGEKLEVTIEINEGGTRLYHYAVTFDPQAPKIHFYHSGYLWLIRVPQYEANVLALAPDSMPPPEFARQNLSEYEDAVRSDPFSAWRHFVLGKFLKAAGDPRGRDVMVGAVRMPEADFTELLPLSHALERMGEIDLAREAFERGYGDFWRRGNDPRLMLVWIGRLVLYSTNLEWDKIPMDHRQELIERLYRLSPHMEASEFAWRLYADYLEKNGPPEMAQLWQKRAREARGATGLFLMPQILLLTDMAILAVAASILAGLLYIVILFRRYRPQRQLDVTARKRQADKPRVIHFFGLEYWSRADRLGFLLIASAGWFSWGVVTGGVAGILRFAAAPLGAANGSYAGPGTKAYFEGLPATPDRDLLLAVAHQHSGELQEAERRYRSLPQFAESWNNLGVILKQAENEQEARQAFERALQLDPHLAEAAYNLGRGTPSLWTELHEKYLLGQPMVAPPRHGRIVRAFLGGSPASLLFNALAGPFATKGPLSWVQIFHLFNIGVGWLRATLIVATLTLALAGGLALVFLVPVREVSQAPGRAHIGWQALFPGTAPSWGFLGGLVLVVWCYFLWQDLLLVWWGSPRVIAHISFPNLKTAFGIPGQVSIAKLINPGWLWVVVAPAVLFAANLFLVWRSRSRT